MPVPYEGATTGTKAREEITKILQRFGCERVGFMDEFADKAVVLAFQHRGRPVHLRASAKGWAAAYLKEHPWTVKRRASRQEYEAAALRQGMVAINSILRDWVKGQVTAIETGILQFDEVFLPHMLTSDGRPMLEALRDQRLLPPPTE